MPGGRPLKFETIELLQEQIDAYFVHCDEKKLPYTITGLAVFLDTSRETISDYKEKPQFSDSIRRAKDKCENYLIENALTGKTNPVTTIFVLKNGYGYKDKSEQEVSVNINKELEQLDNVSHQKQIVTATAVSLLKEKNEPEGV